MQPPTKDQTDIGRDNPIADHSDRDDNKDMARQEQKDESDLHYMLTRFGVTQPRGAPMYGEYDDTLDLQEAINATREARAAYKELPQELRNKFTSMEHLLDAIANGSLVIKDEKAPEVQPTREDSNEERLAALEKVAIFNKSNHTENK